MILAGKNFLIATLSTTKPTWTDMATNSGLNDENPAIKCLSYGIAKASTLEKA